MGVRSWVQSGISLFLIGLVVALIVGQILGQPILLGFVTTGSMAPTLEPGDGFIAIPPVLAGDIEEGDVVTFEAQQLQGGGLTTHRVVDETSQGYITRGDANPFTDQDGPEPPVSEAQIVAVAYQFNGELVVIPGLGTAVMAVQDAFGAVQSILQNVPVVSGLTDGGLGSVMIGFGVLVLVLSVISDIVLGGRGGGARDASRSNSREGVIQPSIALAVIVLLLVIPATASMVVPSGMNEVQIISSQSPSQNPTVIQTGSSTNISYNATNGGFVPRIVIIEPGGVGVEVSKSVLVLSAGESAGTTVRIFAPEETGAYLRVLAVHQYLKILPTSLIVSLHRIHPWVAIIAIDLVIALFVTVIFVLTIGYKPIILRSRSRDVSTLDKLKGMFR